MEGLEASFEDSTDKLRHMNARVDHLLDEALALEPDERSALVAALLDSLDGEDEATVTKAWADEIRRRKDELRSGASSAVPWAEARARLNAL
jgi:putative addiction module component (TIGR02574 family)